MLPITLNVNDRLCVVVGGGPVGRRKAEALHAARARVRVVTLDSRPPDLSPAIVWITDSYRREHLTDAALVFAAATPDVNRQVVADARSLGIWVCSASEPEAGDFILPAVVRRGRLSIAVSTDGTAPALARRIAHSLDDQFDAAYAEWLDLLADFRPLVLSRVADAEQRRRLFESLSDLTWLERLRQQGPHALCEAILAEVEALAPSSERPV